MNKQTQRRQFKAVISLVIIITLVIGLFPPLAAKAAGYNITITNLTVSDTQPEPQNVTMVMTETISVKGGYNGILDSDLSQMTYTVTNVDTGKMDTVTNNKAVKTGNNEYEFQNVLLTEGLNKIQVSYGGTTSRPAWVYFSKVSTVENLTVNGQPFPNSLLIAPQDTADPNYGNSLDIKGIARNATQVKMEMYDQDNQSNGYYNANTGEFQFFGEPQGSRVNADFFLQQPGDQFMTLVASNPYKSYTVERHFAYNNGGPFAFDVKLGGSYLARHPVVSNPSLTLSGKIKVDLNSGNLAFNKMNIILNGDAANPVASVNIASLGPKDSGLSYTPSDPNRNGYDVYDFSVPIALASGSKTQTVQFQFVNDTVTPANEVTPQSYTITFADPNQAYVNRVEMITNYGQSTQTLTSVFNDQIINTAPPLYLRVYANDKTTGLQVLRDASTQPLTGSDGFTIITGPVAAGGGTFYFDLKFSQLPDGVQTLHFVPVNGGTPNANGQLDWRFNYLPTPYVILDNLYNGEVYDEDNQLPNPVTGRLMNVSNTDNVTVTLDGKTLSLAYDSNNGFSISTSGLSSGKHTLTFTVKDPASGQTSVLSWEFHLFLEQAPSITVGIDSSVADKFKNTSQTGGMQYVTKEEEVTFDVDTLHVDKLTVVQNGEEVDSENSISDEDSFEFTYDLEEGANTFVFTATNASGIVTTVTVEVVKEVDPYTIVSPNLNQGNVINSNFVRVKILAKNADSVEINRTEAKMEKDGDDKYFTLEVGNLRPGNNKINFTVNTGQESLKDSFTVYYANAPVVGAEYKAPIKNRLTVFDKKIQLSMPKGIVLQQRGDQADDDPVGANPITAPDWPLLFGIADPKSGQVDFTASGVKSSNSRLQGYNQRFIMASPLYWIDAGVMNDDFDSAGGLAPYEEVPDHKEAQFFRRDPEDTVVPSGEGTLTLEYDTNIREGAWRYVTVFRYGFVEDDDGTPRLDWENLGGTVNERNKTITVPFKDLGYYVVMYMNQSFDDIIAHEWARNALDTLYTRGIMMNKQTSLFVPNDPISRGEFATILVKSFDIPLDYKDTGGYNSGTFTDVRPYSSNSLYDYKYIETAARKGIVRGGAGGRFYPDNPITRQDAAAMIARAAELKLNTNDTRVLASLQKQFTDANAIDYYARSSVEAVAKKGFITGKENTLLEGQKKPTYRFDPKENMTRAEAAVIMTKVLLDNKKIPSL